MFCDGNSMYRSVVATEVGVPAAVRLARTAATTVRRKYLGC